MLTVISIFVVLRNGQMIMLEMLEFLITVAITMDWCFQEGKL